MITAALEIAEETCTFPGCNTISEREGFCLSHAKYFAGPKPKKQPISISKVSDKRKKEQREYVKIVSEMLAINPNCDIREDGCQVKASGLHHMKKRSPNTFLDKRFLKRSCDNCNSWCELFPLEAIAKGHSISKHIKEPV